MTTPGVAGSFVYGFRLPFRSAGQAWETSSRSFLIAERALIGASIEDLVLEEVRPIKLSHAGSRDKVAIVYSQTRAFAPVHRSSVTLLADEATGDLLAVDIRTLPETSTALDNPAVGASMAIAAAERAFEEEFGTPSLHLTDVTIAYSCPSLGFSAKNPLTKIGPAITYQVDLSAPITSPITNAPAIARVHVAATNPPTVLRVEHRVFSSGQGTVTAPINPAGGPNTPQAQTSLPLAYVDVRKDGPRGAIVDTTDEAGLFQLSITPANLYVALAGPYFRVLNTAGANSELYLPGFSGGSVALNASQTEYTSAETAAAYWIAAFHDYIKSVDANDTTMDFQATARVNQAPSCNAFYSPSGVTFLQAGGGCANAAMRSIVLHEMGHWALERYSGTGLSGAFHEGVADAFAYYVAGDACFGEDFNPQETSGCAGKACMRCGLSLIQKCPEGDEGCHGGDVHDEGMVLAGALWKMRARLLTSVGPTADGTANALLLGWLKAFNDGAISQVIVHHMLALDDDDGDLSNLTPHYPQIVLGFADQGFDAEDITAEIVTAPISGAELAPGQSTPISVRVETMEGAPSAVLLHHSIDGIVWNTAPMTEVSVAGLFETHLPGPAPGGTTHWYVTAESTFAESSVTAPRYGESTPRVVHGGKRVVLYRFDFDGTTDEGWTHTLLAGPFGDQFERGDPARSLESTDPKAAYSGNMVFGTDLSSNGFDGRYEPEGSGELRSPPLNLTSVNQVRLSYRRHLAIESAINDRAEILVGQAPIWANPYEGPILDEEWVLHDLDITTLAAGQPAATIAWRLTSDELLEFGGWNIDQVEIYRVDPSGSGSFETFGEPCGQGGPAPQLFGIGSPTLGQTAGVRVEGGPPFTVGAVMVGSQQGFTVLPGGCPYWITPTLGMMPLPLDATGTGRIEAPLPNMPFELTLQFIGFDPNEPTPKIIVSNGLRVKTQ